MAGSKATFNDAINRGHNAAWDGEWLVAIKEYQRALVEFPQDASVHLSLAHAHQDRGQLENAVHECRIASKLQPHDIVPLARLAALLVKLQRASEAASIYLSLAEIHVA